MIVMPISLFVKFWIENFWVLCVHSILHPHQLWSSCRVLWFLNGSNSVCSCKVESYASIPSNGIEIEVPKTGVRKSNLSICRANRFWLHSFPDAVWLWMILTKQWEEGERDRKYLAIINSYLSTLQVQRNMKDICIEHWKKCAKSSEPLKLAAKNNGVN